MMRTSRCSTTVALALCAPPGWALSAHALHDTPRRHFRHRERAAVDRTGGGHYSIARTLDIELA